MRGDRWKSENIDRGVSYLRCLVLVDNEETVNDNIWRLVFLAIPFTHSIWNRERIENPVKKTSEAPKMGCLIGCY